MFCKLSPNSNHFWKTGAGYCVFCGVMNIGDTSVPLQRRNRPAPKVRSEETAYQNWLSESEEGSWIDE